MTLADWNADEETESNPKPELLCPQGFVREENCKRASQLLYAEGAYLTLSQPRREARGRSVRRRWGWRRISESRPSELGQTSARVATSPWLRTTMSAVSSKPLTLARIEDLTLGSFGLLQPSKTLDHLVRFLSTWSGSELSTVSLLECCSQH